MIVYKVGDLFAGVKKCEEEGHKILIPHICNDIGAWGRGFVVPLGKAYPKARAFYMIAKQILGDTILVEEGAVTVANMIAQHKLGGKAIRYAALVKCMQTVSEQVPKTTQIHAPLFGSGLAGGNWDFIEELINEIC